MRILAIETSHDDTSVVIYQSKIILKEYSFSQTEFHKKFGGTVPEYASRGHHQKLLMILKMLKDEKLLADLELIAYTDHPGLIGSLHVGRIFAQGLSLALGVPLRAINHMHAHIFAAGFDNKIEFPSIALIVSGGHTQIWKVNSFFDLKILGQTKDDALGEVYDKIARMMNLGFPGGPIIDELAAKGNNKYDFSLKDDGSLDFSFSGIKTKVKNKINQLSQNGKTNFEKDISASFQKAAIMILKSKLMRAISIYKPISIILGGGVSANSQLRREFMSWHKNPKIPSMRFTTDNAMMVAITAEFEVKNER